MWLPWVSFKVGDRNPRMLDVVGYHVMRCLTLFGGFPSIVADRKKGNEGELHYLVVFEKNLTVHRLLADTGQGMETEIVGDHHDLRMRNMRHRFAGASGRKPWRGRETAIQCALDRYDVNAERYALGLSRGDYETLVRSSFKLFDAYHGHHLLRSIRVGQEPVLDA